MVKDKYFTEAAEEEKQHATTEFNPEIFELGGNISEEEKLQLPYHAASNVCTSMDTVVPRSMAVEQRRFNERLKAAIAEMGMSVEQYVAKKLHYRSVDELCYQEETDAAGNKIARFSAEQIDAIGTAIWNHETGDNGIIVADQAGSGKGRICAGILRYAILELKVVPFFFTEKKHLINDIYRDLIAIGFDAGVPYKFRRTIVVEKTEFTDDEILKIIIQDVKEKDDLRIDFPVPEGFNLEWLRRSLDESNDNYDEVEEIKAEIIEAYKQYFLENGYEKDVYELNLDYKEQVVAALRRGKMLVEPFVPNLIDIKDIDGNIIYEAITKKEADAVYRIKGKSAVDPNLDISQLVLPGKYKLFAMPYSQVSTGYETYHGKKVLKNKIKLFQKYAHGSVICLDESHNASGLICGELTNTGEIVFNLVKSAAMTTYLSATYAKRAENMPLYALKTSIRESGLSDKEMIDTFVNGGNSLQEAVSAELARNGQLLRREKIIQGSSEYYYENEGSETGDNQIAKLDRVATVYKKVLDFSQSVRDVIREYKEPLPKEEKDKIKPARGVNALAFQLFNFMLLGLKIRQTTEFAIKKLQSGRKTVIAVASTMESALDNLSKTFMSNTAIDAYKVGDKIKNDFSLYMAYLLNYTMRYNTVEVKVDSEGNEDEIKQLVYVLDSSDELSTLIKDRLLGSYKAMLAEILEFETGIPIAPLDMIERNIKEAGFSISEITGRQRKIIFDADTEYGTIAKREIKKTDIVVREFNENEIDCLVINQSGATGISMQALPNKKANIVYESSVDASGEVVENAPTSLENKKEVKKRAMVITQMELDINKEVQKLGRINRMGQVYQPEYTYIISAIPSESRLTSLMEKKLRSLSANVSSNQQQSSYLFTSDDFFSNIAVPPFNETMQEVGMRGVEVTTGSQIQDFTKTLYFKDYTLQKDFYDTFSKKLQQEIETLTSQGLYTGKMTHKDYFAETIIKHPFYIGDNNAKTSFGRHSFIEKCSVKLYRERFTEKKIEQQITENMVIEREGEGKENLFFSKIEAFQKKANEILTSFENKKREQVEKANKSYEQAIEKIELAIKETMAKIAKFSELELAISLETELKTVNDAITVWAKAISDAAMKGDMTTVQESSVKMGELHSQKKILEEKIQPMLEMLKQKGEYKSIERELKNLRSEKESEERRKLKNEKAVSEYSEIVANGRTYLSKIGNIMQLDVYEPVIIYDEDSVEERIKEYRPNKKFSHPVVVTGVSFPETYDELTPGRFEVHLCGVSEKYSYSLFRLEKHGHATEILTLMARDYKGKWNELAGKSDNSYRENRYIIVGSLLKTFSLGKSNEISGQIIKYNTADGKTRIGIEVADNEDQKNGQKSVYKILEERYSGETALQRPIYYDGNPENVRKFIEEYIHFYMFGETVEKVEKGVMPDEGTFQPTSMPREFIFQISSVERNIFVLISVDEQLRIDASECSKMYNAKRFGEIVKITKETVIKGLSVKIVSDSVQAADFLAYYFKLSTGVEISTENYEIAGKSKNFPNAAMFRSKQIDRLRFHAGSQFKYYFPTNIISLEQAIMFGVPYTARLKMSYEHFITLIEYLAKKRMKPTFATANGYFERHKGEYVFEQFLDEIESEKTMTPASEVVFNESVEKELSDMIDELVNILA